MTYAVGDVSIIIDRRGKMFVVKFLNDKGTPIAPMLSLTSSFWIKEASLKRIKTNVKDAIRDEKLECKDFDYEWRQFATTLQEDMESIYEEEKFTPAAKEDGDISVSSLILNDGTIIEQILNDNHPKFAVSTEGNIEYMEYFTEGESTYVPIQNDIIKKGAVKFPNVAEPYESLESLVDEIKSFIKKYVDFSDEFLEIAAWYIILSWVYDRLNTIPYLRLLGDYGTGKSRALDVLGGICYKPCIVSGAVTPAPIYRIIEQFKGTLIVDEGDLRQSDEKNEVVTILNCGFERNRPVIRCKKDDPDNIQTFDAFCPKLISSRKLFWDQALESRCMTETMGQTTRTDIPETLPDEFYEEQQAIRNKLLMFRFNNYNEINTTLSDQERLDNNLEPRLRQSARAFVVIFSHDKDMMNRFKRFLQHYQRKLVEDRAETLEGMIATAIWDLAAEITPEGHFTPGDIAIKIPTKKGHATPQTVGRVLTGMKIKRILKRVDGEPKRVVVWDDSIMKDLFRRYVITYHEIVTGVTDKTTIMASESLLASLFPNTNKKISLPPPIVTSVTDDTKTVKKSDKCSLCGGIAVHWATNGQALCGECADVYEGDL